MKIFMISYGGGHSNMISAVYKELIKNPDNDITYAALTGAPLKLQDTDVNFITISELAKKLPYYDRLKKLGEKYGTACHNSASGIPVEDTIYYYGIGMHDLIEKYGVAEAENRFNKMNRKAFLPVESLKVFLRRFAPDVCVITSSPRMEKATGIAAEGLGIPVVRINDLPICDPIEHECQMCVMNDWAREYAINVAGMLPDKVHVTGQPTFEADFNIERTYIDTVKEKCGADKYKAVVTFFAENGADQSREIAALMQTAMAMENVLFVVKLHPNQTLNLYDTPDLPNVYVTNADAKPYFHFSNLVITTFSTTGMEAALFGIPVIVINLDGRKYAPDYIEMGIAVLCDDTDRLQLVIKTYLDKGSPEYLALKEGQKRFQFVKNAAQNIRDVIEKAGRRT